MAYPATKRFTYLGQLAVLVGFTSAGFLLGSMISLIPFIVKGDLGSMAGLSSSQIMDKLLVPENASILRVVQFLSTLCMFFLPTVAYAWYCHKKTFIHLGLNKKVDIQQAIVVIVIMMACLPLVGALSDLTERLPFSKATFEKFKAAEEAYNRQVAVIGRMDNFRDYLVSLIMLAILPAVFEETLFRGGLQNLLSRWWNAPVLAIVVTSIIFSAVHGSYLGFLSRAVLGFVLGWMYYRTGNLWLNIIAHAANNTIAVTTLYIMRRNNPHADLSKADPHFAMWWGFIAIIVVYILFILFEKVSSFQVNQPGREVLIPLNNNEPLWADAPREPENL
jgi:membrane protease YdiL (CAAX protease family)